MTAPLFENLAAVRAGIRSAPHLLLCLDFDGTLAPLVAHPANAYIPQSTRSILAALTLRPDFTVAVVSGRAMPDLAARVGLDIILAANHGLEIAGNGLHFHHPEAESLKDVLACLSWEISRQTTRIPGALVEDKGLTASVHFRNVAEAGWKEISSIVRAAVAKDHERFEVREGNKVFEIRPRVQWNKGSAVMWILSQLLIRKSCEAASVCYIGDDVTDEDAFCAIDGVTIRVGGDAPTAARYRVPDTRETARFLEWLLITPVSADQCLPAPDLTLRA